MISEYVRFLVHSTLFTSTIVFIAFGLSWLLYDKILTRGINLRDALFEKDNFAAWLEFIGAFILPVFFLSAWGIEGEIGKDYLTDWLVSAGYAIFYVICFLVLRLFSGTIVKALGGMDKVELNIEVFQQKNAAASLFSITLSIVFMTIVQFFDYSNIVDSLFKMCMVTIFSLFAFLLYHVFLGKRSTIFKEVFIDNNAAAGASFLGFILAIEYLMANSVKLQTVFQIGELALMSAVLLVIFFLLVCSFRWIFVKILKIDLFSEVYEQNNVGAACGEAGLYVGIAMLIIHFIK